MSNHLAVYQPNALEVFSRARFNVNAPSNRMHTNMQRPGHNANLTHIAVSDVQVMSGNKVTPLAQTISGRIHVNLPEAIGEGPLNRANIWRGTSFQGPAYQLGDVDLTDYFTDFDDVGFEWCRRDHSIKACLTTRGESYYVRIPWSTIRKVFQSVTASAEHFKELLHHFSVGESRVDGIFSDIGDAIGGGFKSVGKLAAGAYNAIVPDKLKKAVKNAAKVLKVVINKVGKRAVKIASSPAFGAVMGALAVTPPLTAVGGVGLAAYAAANTAKPFVEAASTFMENVSPKERAKIQKNLDQSINALPPNARKLMVSALKSVPAAKGKIDINELAKQTSSMFKGGLFGHSKSKPKPKPGLRRPKVSKAVALRRAQAKKQGQKQAALKKRQNTAAIMKQRSQALAVRQSEKREYELTKKALTDALRDMLA